ncbi:MAG TPA: DUF930 domain-containing protein [Xanthobacteraceae bacterium]|nr:DUF930 domain-containing protein [Xanthobacteraceae bacterium]
MRPAVVPPLALLILLAPSAVQARKPDPAKADARMQQSLMKLDPAARAAQLCDLGGLKKLGRDAKWARTDRVVIDALSTPKIEGPRISGAGGALRSQGRWYRFDFTCTLSAEQTAVTGFDYRVGTEIPEAQWSDLGLWE